MQRFFVLSYARLVNRPRALLRVVAHKDSSHARRSAHTESGAEASFDDEAVGEGALACFVISEDEAVGEGPHFLGFGGAPVGTTAGTSGSAPLLEVIRCWGLGRAAAGAGWLAAAGASPISVLTAMLSSSFSPLAAFFFAVAVSLFLFAAAVVAAFICFSRYATGSSGMSGFAAIPSISSLLFAMVGAASACIDAVGSVSPNPGGVVPGNALPDDEAEATEPWRWSAALGGRKFNVGGDPAVSSFDLSFDWGEDISNWIPGLGGQVAGGEAYRELAL